MSDFHKSKKRLFWFIMFLFALNIFVLIGGIGFIYVGEINIGSFWILCGIGGFFVNVSNLKENLKS